MYSFMHDKIVLLNAKVGRVFGMKKLEWYGTAVMGVAYRSYRGGMRKSIEDWCGLWRIFWV